MPSGLCIGLLSKGRCDYDDEDCLVALPGEVLEGVPFPDGGMMWWCPGVNCNNVQLEAIYLCN